MGETELSQAERLRVCLIQFATMGGDVVPLVDEALIGIQPELMGSIRHNLQAVLYAVVVKEKPVSPIAKLSATGQQEFSPEHIQASAKALPESMRKMLREVGDSYLKVHNVIEKLWGENKASEAWRAAGAQGIAFKPIKGRPKSDSAARSRAISGLAQAELINVRQNEEQLRKQTPGAKVSLWLTPL